MEFGPVTALNDASVEIRAGDIHALVGQNGAGKSTLLGILSGRLHQTSGVVDVFGQRLTPGDPRASHGIGIATVYQELTMIPELHAPANVFLGQPLSKGYLLSERRMRSRFEELCNSFGVSIPATVPVGLLPVAYQQMVEIMRGLQSHARIVLLDEPSASLAEAEREALWRLLRDLKARDVTVVFVSHNLDEVLEISDTITVFRDGKIVVSAPAREFSKQSLVRAMVGRDVEVPSHRTSRATNRIVLSAQNVSVPGRLYDVNLQVREGEILGLAGLVGSGRTTLLRSLAGLEPAAHGDVTIDDAHLPWPHTVRKALRAGLALIPDDRRKGLALGLPVADNVFLGVFERVARYFWIQDRRKSQAARRAVEMFRLKGHVDEPVRSLSGGNQQKVLLAKWVVRQPRVLLVDDPTKGIDVGAKVEVLESLDSLAATGLPIIMASSEVEEIMALSDRVLVLRDGQVAADLGSDGMRFTKSDILEHAFGTWTAEQ